MGKVVSGVVNAVKKVFTTVVKVVQKVVNFVYDNLVSPIAKGIFGKNFDNMLRGIINLPFNVVLATIDAVATVTSGILEGDWKKLKEGFVKTVTIGVGIVATATAITSGNWYLLPMVGMYLDMQTNNGEATKGIIGFLGDIESALLGTRLIHNNAELIEATIFAVSSIATSWVAGGAISHWTNSLISSAGSMEQYFSTAKDIFGYYSAFDSIYSGYIAIVTANERYQQAFEQWLSNYQSYKKAMQGSNSTFEDIQFSNDVYRYYANGDIYNSFAPCGDNFNPMVVNEPYFYILRFSNMEKQRWQEINDALEYRILDNCAGTRYFENSIDSSMKITPFNRIGFLGNIGLT
ncbi:TPA: hypothetical protein R5723_000180 [Campylobacter jejuni]|nr:hypothetical protein [Campylobacter jejuni]ECL2360736.1 hypothetical protein [Campylobacter jejuni]ECL3806368.1 hypothetical protein [Campylobacter jejuni]ECP8538598.1 hypothetical protein [Campylobacter jejuni]ECP8551469.1 hypothetical protein [Campylobacter jejuni]